jgi:hypothetical protein
MAARVMPLRSRHALYTEPDSSAPPEARGREDRDAYLIGIIRALDTRINRIQSRIPALPESRALRQKTVPVEHHELRRRLSDLQSARQDLVDVVFRCPR